ncbi:MAG TPA: long-chain fatty acid--CoA ligase [Gaiellaceae bacterium]|nr:long-chain fatty acid--CoA ligase [Gaiellaceae bacterium]
MDAGAAPARSRTIPALWRDAVASGREGPAYLVEHSDHWHPVSWPEAARRVDELANGLLALGLRKGDTFVILGNTRLEWSLFDFALASVGGVGAPIYMNSSPKDAQHVAEHSEAVGALVEDDVQRAKLDGLALRHVLTYADLDDLAARGRAFAAENPGALDAAVAAIDEDDLFTYIYTSGTTGPPKACMISHRNYYAMVAVVDGLPRFVLPSDVMLLYLPLAHNFGRLMHLVAPYVGFTLAHLDDPLRAAEALTAVRPTIFPSVPRVFEKVHAAVVAQIEAAPGPRRRIAEWALKVGYEVSALRQADKPVPAGLALRHRVADRLLYSKVKNRLGGHLRLGLSGGAPLAKEIIEFFHALDILILEAYGLTECTSGATSNRLDAYRFGSVGRALPGTELRLAEDGELLIRSETVFSGYFKDPEATREVLSEDGWLRSGDIAAIDTEGYVTITDRKKDILVTAGGKNVAPQNIENLLKLSPLVSQALVVGDRRPYIAALITLDQAADAADAEKRVGEAVEAANAELSRFEQVKRFRILARDFSADEGEITPTLKLKRRVIEQHFAAEIDELYS